MKVIRFVPLRSLFKVAPATIITLFFITNLTGLLLKTVAAPGELAVAIADSIDPEVTPLDIPSDIPSSGNAALDRVIFQAGERHGVDPRFLHAVIWKESGYRVDAKSSGGARGLMQLLPSTAHRFGCDNLDDAASNVDAGAGYLRWLLRRFDGNVALALAAYNAGEGAVDKYHGIPPFSQTQDYVRLVSARYGKSLHPVMETTEAQGFSSGREGRQVG